MGHKKRRKDDISSSSKESKKSKKSKKSKHKHRRDSIKHESSIEDILVGNLSDRFDVVPSNQQVLIHHFLGKLFLITYLFTYTKGA